MKKYFLLPLIILCLLSFDSMAQSKEKVNIIKPGGRAVILLKDYFNDDITKELLMQISPEKLTEIKENCNESSYPSCLKTLLKTYEEDDSELIQSLTAYRIATYENIRGGKNYGEQSILEVPGNENQNLMESDCVFSHSIYIIMYSKDIEVEE